MLTEHQRAIHKLRKQEQIKKQIARLILKKTENRSLAIYRVILSHNCKNATVIVNKGSELLEDMLNNQSKNFIKFKVIEDKIV